MNRKRNLSFIQKVKQKLVSPIAWLALVVFSILLVTGTTIASSLAQNPAKGAGNASTQAYAGFKGKIGRTLAESTPSWTPQPPSVLVNNSLASSRTTAAPKGAPNIVVFLIDDLGFSDLSPYGSEISTPNIEKLAANGLRFSNFTTHQLCSPTRASLLTGLNAHSAGVGWVAEGNPGFPGYAGEIQSNVVTLAEILRGNGYSTLLTGKWHLTQTYDRTATASLNSWPLQRGFEHFFGFLDGLEHPQKPHILYEDNTPISVDRYPENFLTTDYWTEKAIALLKQAKTKSKDKPFFLYFANNAVHSPFNIHPADLAKYKGKYDVGWDVLRQERYQKQLASKLIPAETQLPPQNPGVKGWDTLSAEDKKLFARYQEAYAAFVDNLDQNFGKLYEYLESTGELNNTIIIVASDNGGSGEGGANGTTNVARHYSGLPDDKALDISRFNLIGSPQTAPHYPIGWATVSNTPLKRYKFFTLGGGRRNPLIVSYPAKIKDLGATRTQFTHITDITPTLLELTGIKHPDRFNGKPTKPLEGISFAYLLNDANTPSQRTEQYYENSGNRGYYKDGWYAVTDHQTGKPFSDSEWQLYNLNKDYSESNNVANQYPEKVKELAAAFDAAAFKYQVYPLLESPQHGGVPPYIKEKVKPKTFHAGDLVLEPDILPLVSDRDYTIQVEAQYKAGDRGVILAHGGQEVGYIFYIDDGKLFYEHNNYGQSIKFPPVPLQPGQLHIDFNYDALGKRQGSGTLSVNGQQVAAGKLGLTFGGFPYEGLDIGKDARSPVSWDLYKKYGVFKYTGAIEQVKYVPGSPAPDTKE
ncbi:MAG: arylsulfatase [Nostoc sp. NOS(2021)]|uniref:arylsulfatase n=1 Tax=Nostoc sp. NOS(2021) TaxID=2815407 RepID=UPI0025CC1A1F|nr:arylsulfatase [Nostoc sp. NOS(2021)]MBN3899666.1 arylsulfatase [Nostoc sp. NOS(2021)]